MSETINIRKNSKRPILHLIADMELGEYYAVIDDGLNKQEVHRKVTEESQENFHKEVKKSRMKKIMEKFHIGKKDAKNVETIAYKTLEDFDRIYNTDYSKKYVNIMTMDIKDTKKKRESSLSHRKYCEELRREKLKKAGIVIDYNLPVMEGIVRNKHKMGTMDKLKFIIYASKSKRNGANINFKLRDKKKKDDVEIFKNKITMPKINNTDVKEEKMTKKKEEKMTKKKEEKRGLKGLYRAVIISLGILGGAVGFIKGMEDEANKEAQIELMMDTNSNSLDKQKDSKDNNKTNDQVTPKATSISKGGINSIEEIENSNSFELSNDLNNNNLLNNKETSNKKFDKLENSIKQSNSTDSKVAQKVNSTNKTEEEAFNDRIVVKGIKPYTIKDDKDMSSEETKKKNFTQIKIGSKVTINSGKFFETATGEGKSGSFEKQDKGPRVLSLIKITTKNGNNILIQKDDDRNLYQLKNRYPNAKFAYHFTDVHGNAYGWVTKDSFANNLKRDKEQPKKEKEQRVQKVAAVSKGKKEQQPKEKKLQYGEMDEDGWIPERY